MASLKRPNPGRSFDLAEHPVPALTHLLSGYVPGYAILAKFLSLRLGVDPDKVLAIVGFWFAGWAGIAYLKNTVIPRVLSTFTSCVRVSINHPVHQSVFQWLRTKGVFDAATDLRVETRNEAMAAAVHNGTMTLHSNGRFLSPRSLAGYASQTRQGAVDLEPVGSVTPDTELFNFRTSGENKPPTYMPNNGSHWFLHGWAPFMVTCAQDSITITCLGYSTQPIKALIAHAHTSVKEGKKKFVDVFRSDSTGRWLPAGSRLGRGLDTITFDQNVKLDLLTDVQSFLQPGQESWYAARGIPYRRGYLFHGPPGCGKTSLAHSLAGTFGLSIYALDLSRSNFQEADLALFIEELPARCVLVIEDIDAIASNREDQEENNHDKSPFHSHRSHRISLSGLLNAIDGMLSHEGHLLIMTTNHPEHLDAALTRPGRVDKKIEFSFTGNAQNFEIFTRMFGTDRTKTAEPLKTIRDACRPHTPGINASSYYSSLDDLINAAHRFAALVPEHMFSPAAVQDLLLEHIRDPEAAIAGVQDWVVKQRAAQAAAEAQRLKRAGQRSTQSAPRMTRMLPGVDAPVSPEGLSHLDERTRAIRESDYHDMRRMYMRAMFGPF